MIFNNTIHFLKFSLVFRFRIIETLDIDIDNLACVRIMAEQTPILNMNEVLRRLLGFFILENLDIEQKEIPQKNGGVYCFRSKTSE